MKPPVDLHFKRTKANILRSQGTFARALRIAQLQSERKS